MHEYRPVPDEMREAFHRMRDYAFVPHKGRQTYDSEEDFPTHLAKPRGLFDVRESTESDAAERDGPSGDDLLCICSYHDFTARVRGERFSVGGVSSVASPPENRRGGLIRELLFELLCEFREEGIHLSALWPFEYEFYRRYGWEMVDTRTSYEFDPEAVAFADEEPRGDFRQVEADDYDRLDSVYEQFVADYDLATERSEEWWRHRVFEHWREDPYVYCWEADGEPRGYVVYTVVMEDEANWDRKLNVHELAYADPEARRQLLRFLYYHDSQVETVSVSGPAETRLLDMAPDPRAVTCERKPGVMFRLVDVAAAVEMLPYAADVEGTLTLAVADSLLDWNDDTFELSFADGRATCRPTTTDSPDAHVDVTTLAQLYAGYFGPHEAATYGSLTVENPAATDLLSAAFPTAEVYLPERF